MHAATEKLERRRHPRFTVGMPVRLRAEGAPAGTMIELSDISIRGCKLRALSEEGTPDIDTRVAIGFVLPDREIALARARVVRRIDETQGGGVGLVIDRANVPFYRFLITLAESERAMAA
jgi:hypothetical protein